MLIVNSEKKKKKIYQLLHLTLLKTQRKKSCIWNDWQYWKIKRD